MEVISAERHVFTLLIQTFSGLACGRLLTMWAICDMHGPSMTRTRSTSHLSGLVIIGLAKMYLWTNRQLALHSRPVVIS